MSRANTRVTYSDKDLRVKEPDFVKDAFFLWKLDNDALLIERQS